MALDLLLKEAKGMSEVTLMEVVHYMRYLKITAARTPEKTIADKEKYRYRTAGKYQGKGWMSDDFDALPDDFKEYM